MTSEWREAPEAEFAVIGDPVSHSLSPKMHGAAFAALGLSHRYVSIRVARGEVREALAVLRSHGYLGVNVTIPHKEEAFEAVQTTDDFAICCRAVNTIRLADMEGTNTDGSGFLDTVEGQIDPGATVLLLGAGGSARAIALALTQGGYNLRIFNRTAERARLLVSELGIDAAVVDTPTVEDAQLIVNATSASLAQESLPIDWRAAPPSALAYDLVYGSTPFLTSAGEAGLRVMDGTELLVAQGARSLAFWLGLEAPRDVMLEAIR
jgi:shikimate dehydrogenase